MHFARPAQFELVQRAWFYMLVHNPTETEHEFIARLQRQASSVIWDNCWRKLSRRLAKLKEFLKSQRRMQNWYSSLWKMQDRFAWTNVAKHFQQSTIRIFVPNWQSISGVFMHGVFSPILRRKRSRDRSRTGDVRDRSRLCQHKGRGFRYTTWVITLYAYIACYRITGSIQIDRKTENALPHQWHAER